MSDFSYDVTQNKHLLSKNDYTYTVRANNVEFTVTSKQQLTDKQIKDKIKYNNENAENEFVFCDLDSTDIDVKNLASAKFTFDKDSSGNKFNCQEGVEVTVQGDLNTINTGSGSDYILIDGGRRNKVNTNGGDDSVAIVNKASGNTVDTGNGKDTINVVSGDNNTITGGRGSDTYKIQQDARFTVVNAKKGFFEPISLKDPDEIINNGKQTHLNKDKEDHVR